MVFVVVFWYFQNLLRTLMVVANIHQLLATPCLTVSPIFMFYAFSQADCATGVSCPVKLYRIIVDYFRN
ncbi:hypothetical protein GQ55_7G317700 [Panicum hallii var. hallii]|uniref:Uncharacterized protein n=1 Tax=Panicum hallii var. hallii TaxID=1504633 RepID=A0A2T7D174_9POAL|nr:hypothetical protein GQ55_7G317700 [Panicum hallii var. hallii]